MGIAEWLLKKLYRHPMVIPARGDGSPYLRRYKLLKLFGYGIYIHEILQSDDDSFLHDHPFDFTSVILSGCYYEYMPDCIRLRTRGKVIHHKAIDAHRLVLNGGPTWTLFIRGPKYREWGFITDKGWVPYYQYLDKSTDEME